MIKWVPIFIIGIILNGCDSNKVNEVKKDKFKYILNDVNQKKVELLIESFLKDTLSKKFEFIPQNGIVKIDSAFRLLIDDSLRFKLSAYKTTLYNFNSQKNKIESLIQKHKSIYRINEKQIYEDTTLLHYRFDRIKIISNDLIEYANNLPNDFVGWKINYQFTLKSEKNTHTYFSYFVIDSNFSKILLFSDEIWGDSFNIDVFKAKLNTELKIKNLAFDINRILLKTN
jgi:hypothetical protein